MQALARLATQTVPAPTRTTPRPPAPTVLDADDEGVGRNTATALEGTVVSAVLEASDTDPAVKTNRKVRPSFFDPTHPLE